MIKFNILHSFGVVNFQTVFENSEVLLYYMMFAYIDIYKCLCVFSLGDFPHMLKWEHRGGGNEADICFMPGMNESVCQVLKQPSFPFISLLCVCVLICTWYVIYYPSPEGVVSCVCVCVSTCTWYVIYCPSPEGVVSCVCVCEVVCWHVHCM